MLNAIFFEFCMWKLSLRTETDALKLAPRPTGEAEFQKAEVFEQNKNFVQSRGSEMVELLRLSPEHLLFCKIGPRSQYWSTAD